MPKTRTAPRMRRSWRTPDALWAQIAPLLPPGKPHPLGCHNPRVDDRRAMDAIFFRLRTGCQWNALSATGLCRRLRRIAVPGVARGRRVLGAVAARAHGVRRAEGDRLALARRGRRDDKAPLGGENHRAQSDGSGKQGTKRAC
jgi:transposase